MERVTSAHRLQVVELYYENHRSVKQVYRALRGTYGRNSRPTERTIAYTTNKFQTQFSFLDDQRPNRPHSAYGEKNIAAVA